MKTNYSTLYLVRHGESEANVADIRGAETPLTEKGKTQAKDLAKKFKSLKFDAIFSSPLVRAKETAEIIAKEHKLEVLTKEALRERHEGILEGQAGKDMSIEVKKMYQMRKDTPYETWKTMTIAEGYETDEHLMSRFITALREIAIAFPNKTVLIGSHVGLIKTLLVHLGVNTHKNLPAEMVKNTAYVKLRTDGIDFFIEETNGIEPILS